MKRVLVVGEGPNELGHEPGPDKPAARGVLEALARTQVSEGWEVAGRLKWKDIPKYKVGGHKSAEERNLLGALYRAKEQQYDAVLLARDTDGEKERQKLSPWVQRVTARRGMVRRARAARQGTHCWPSERRWEEGGAPGL